MATDEGVEEEVVSEEATKILEEMTRLVESESADIAAKRSVQP